MNSKITSLIFCVVLVSNAFFPFAQIIDPPDISLNGFGGSGGLADSQWPMFRGDEQHTGQSPYNTSDNPGKLKWIFKTKGHIRSSPAIGPDGTIYIGSFDEKLYAIHPTSQQKWNFTTGGWVRSSPAIGADGTIYVGSDDRWFYAIHPNGTMKWRFFTFMGIFSSPVIGPNGTVYFGSYDNRFYALYPNGTLKWKFVTLSGISSSPAIGPDGTIYFGSQDSNVYALNPDGTKKWAFTTGSQVRSSPAVGPDGTIYIGSDDHRLYAINPDGTEKWHFVQSNIIDSSPAIDVTGTIYVGSFDGNLYAINPDGTKKWSFPTDSYISLSSPAISADGTIFIGSDDHKVYAVYPNGTEKWSFETEDWVASSPAIDSNGTVYVGSLDYRLFALGIPPKYDNPVAVAGEDHTVNQYDAVHFDGSGSYDPFGTIKEYSWDLDANVDSDGDGNYTNDVDATGPTLGHIYSDIGVYNATLTVTSFGKEGEIVYIDQDAVFCVDTSEGMTEWEIGYAKWGLVEYSYKMGVPDQGCVITFGENTSLIGPLTNDYIQLRKDIASIPIGDGDYTSMAGALRTAMTEIDTNHKTGHVQVIILLTDGSPTDGTPDYVRNLASLAALKNIMIYTIGLEPRPGKGILDKDLLKDIADITDGKYFYAPDYTYLDNIYLDIFRDVEFPKKPRYGYDTTTVTVNEQDPLDEGSPFQFNGPKSHTLKGSIVSYKWDFDSNVDSNGDGNFTNDVDAKGPTPTHIYGDNGVYEVTLTVKSAGKEGKYEKIDQDVVFCADTSGSMAPESIDLMKAGLTNYVDEMYVPDQGSVIKFGGIPELLTPLTDNYTELKNEISGIPGPAGATFMVGALEDSITELRNNGTTGNIKLIILLTDGQPTDGTADDVRDMADEAKAENITIYTIGLEPSPGFGGLDEDLLRDVANTTGGKYFYAPDASYLRDIYIEIANRVIYPGILPQTGMFTRKVIVNNIDPSIDSVTDPLLNLGTPANFTTSVSDPGSDDLTVVWEWGDGSSDSISIYYNDGVSPDPYPSPEVNPMDLLDSVYHTYYNRGNYTITITVFDDDNGSCQEQIIVEVKETMRAQFSWSPDPQDEGYPVQFTDESTFNPNDTISWSWEFGGLGSSSLQNPQFTFMDDGTYPVTLTISRDDGTSVSITHDVTILDLAPTADFSWSPNPQLENKVIQFMDLSTSYPDKIVGWIWDFGDGVTSSQRNTSHVYGDDGIYPVKLTVIDDDNSTDSIVHNVTVLNVDPNVVIESVTMDVEIGLRVAGRKWNNVSMTLYEDGVQFGNVSIQRMPGSPNEQMAWVPKVLDMTKTYSVILHYIPVDPPYLGANPVWIYVKFPNGSIQKIYHTFNVQQSKERDSDHWNHIDPWEVDLKAHLIGWEFEVEYHVTDPGSDDEILSFSCGSQNKTITQLCNPPNPDPYPSPEIHPMDIYGTATLVYEGPGTLTLIARDDDNIRLGIGERIDTIDIT
jgi:outer membrane protein assembly factor BamB